MATKKSSKKTAKKAVKTTTKKSVKKTAKKAVKKTAKKSSSASKAFEDMPEPVVYRPSDSSGDNLPLGVPEKKSSLTVYLVAGVLIAISIFFVYRSIGRSSADQDMSIEQPSSSPAMEAVEQPSADATEPAAETAPVVEEAAPAAAEANTYTVKAGDTFWGIAKSELGDGKRAKEIQSMNTGVTTLKKGMTLQMPAK